MKAESNFLCPQAELIIQPHEIPKLNCNRALFEWAYNQGVHKMVESVNIAGSYFKVSTCPIDRPVKQYKVKFISGLMTIDEDNFTSNELLNKIILDNIIISEVIYTPRFILTDDKGIVAYIKINV